MRLLLLAPLLLLPGLSQAQGPNCVVDLKAGDDMQYDQFQVTVSSGCAQIELKLTHTGKLPVAAMGHNIVVTDANQVLAVAGDGLKAGAAAGYLPPADQRVIAATKMIGGGETASATIPGGKLVKGGSYAYFCSFPGHHGIMKGMLIVE